MNFEEIKDILVLIDKTGLEYVKLKNKDIELEISKKKSMDNNKFINDKNINCDEKNKNLKIKESIDENIINENINKEDKKYEIKAPLIGTYYSSPSPDKPCYVKIGDYVEKGDTLCIIEAMKMMNEIKSENSGKIVDIKVKNESIVEYGQVLFIIQED